jgi:hypothetical protein
MTLSRAEASRINGAKSNGPKTEDGRRAASLNAVKHGLTAETVVLPNESEEEYQAELHGYLQHFAPANKPEADLVLQLASAQWRLARYTAVETSLFDIQMEKSCKYVDKEWKNIDESRRVALAFQALSGAHSPLALLNRYQARLHHEYQRILKALLQLQAARRADQAKLQNEPKPDAQTSPALLHDTAGSCLLTHISESDITESEHEGEPKQIPTSGPGHAAHPIGIGG